MISAEPTRGGAMGQSSRSAGPAGESGTRNAASTPPEAAAVNAHPHRRGLWIVGLFKLSKTAFFCAVGVGALKLIHRDVGYLTTRFIAWSHIDTEGRMASLLMERADLVTHHQLRQGALFAFLYAGLCLIEGTGLLLEKRWAEYFTVVLTTMALPWEGYELSMRFAWYKVLLTLINVAVLLYLLWVLKRKGLLGENGEDQRL